MPINNQGVRQCDKCKSDFTWLHFEVKAYRATNLGVPEAFPQLKHNETLVHDYKRENHITSYKANCPFCDYDNFFDVATNQ